MIRLLLALLAFALPAAAETAVVRSGEHDGFTRLVIDLPTLTRWTLGRTESGYAFATDTTVQPEYDLSRVWDLIPRSRLSRLDADPATGVLGLVLGCDCHAFPFEARPGSIVIDIKPGPPPAASVFEMPFATQGNSAARSESPDGPGYDWIAGRAVAASPTATTHPAVGIPLPLDTGSVSLEPLREELLEQIARGAVDGIVDMELPGKPGRVNPVDRPELPWSNIHLGESPGLIVTKPDDFVEGGRPEQLCVDPELVDLSAWGGAAPPLEMLASARAGLYGEFDKPDPEAIRHGVQMLLYLGFGAEARQTADLAAEATPDGIEYLRSMGKLVDGQTDPDSPFVTMLECDSPAALWAALAQVRLPAGSGVNRDAILQSFVALPAHLRSFLGPPLAEKFLARDDAEAARIVRDAMERAPEADKASVALLDAKTELQQDEPAAAQVHAASAVAFDGDGTDGLVTLVESHFRTLDPITSETAEALRSLQGEAEGTEEAPAVDRAVVLALALSGQIDAAFQEPAANGPVLGDLWRVTEDRATDDDFLRKAVLPAGQEAPDVAPALAEAIAGRLLALGFPDAALVWLSPVNPEDLPGRRRLAAEATLQQGNAGATLNLLAGLEDPSAAALRARALVQLDKLPEAARQMVEAGAADQAIRLGPWREDWSGLDPALPEPWLAAAGSLTDPAPDPAAGPLGRGNAALEASAASRAAIDALLSSVTTPAKP